MGDEVPAARIGGVKSGCETLALVLAAGMVAGSLYLSMGMGLRACPLCLYQRTLAMGVLAVLAAGLGLRLSPAPGTLSLLALPLAVCGLGVAGLHVYLDRSGVLDCPLGVWGIGYAPDQSLAASVLLTAVLVAGSCRARIDLVRRWGGLVSGVVMGVLLAVAAAQSAPPLPPPSPKFTPAGERILLGCEPAAPPSVSAAASPVSSVARPERAWISRGPGVPLGDSERGTHWRVTPRGAHWRVTPAKAGVQPVRLEDLDSGFRRHDVLPAAPPSVSAAMSHSAGGRGGRGIR